MPTFHSQVLGTYEGTAGSSPCIPPGGSHTTLFFQLGTFGPVVTFLDSPPPVISAGTPPPGMTPFVCPGGTSTLWMVGTPTAVGHYTYTIDVTMSNGSHTFWDCDHTVSLAGGCSTITITPSPLPEMALATVFNQQMLNDVPGSYTWDLPPANSLPPGLSLSSSGLLSGVPTLVGTYSFAIRATNNSTGCIGIRAYTVTVLAEPTAVDYWTTTDPAAFPASRIMIMSPNVGTNYSRGKAVTLVAGTALTNYPASNLVDDSADSPLRISERQFDLYVDLTVDRTPNAVALFNHNIDATRVVEVYVGPSPASFTRIASFAAGTINGWLDLRAFSTSSRTGRYWRIKISTNNSIPVTMGELVIGNAFVLEGVLSENWNRASKYFIEREFTEEMLPYKMHSGARARQLQMSFIMDPTNRSYIEQTFDDAGITGNRVVVIPNTRKNDPYFIDWPSRRQINFPQSLRESKIDLTLTEQSVGVI